MAAQSNVVLTPVVFNFDSLSIRAVADEHGNPWFVASDICHILGYKNVRQAVTDNCKEAGVSKRYIRSGDQSREVTLINEGNLYRLIIRSQKPAAERFEAQVMEEILPAIRKTGSYQRKTESLPPTQAETLAKQIGRHLAKALSKYNVCLCQKIKPRRSWSEQLGSDRCFIPSVSSSWTCSVSNAPCVGYTLTMGSSSRDG